MKAKRPSVALEPPAPAPAPPPLPQASRLDAISSDNGLIAHFINPKSIPPMPWELPLEARQRRSKDPRTVKHIADIDRWNETPLREVWARIRNFAEAKKDWIMTRYDVINWLKSEGIVSEIVIDRLIDVFEAKDAGTVQAYTESMANGVAALTKNCPAASFGFGGSSTSNMFGGGNAATLSGLGLLPGVSGHGYDSPSAVGRQRQPNTASSTEGAGRGLQNRSAASPPPASAAGQQQFIHGDKLLTFHEKELLAKHQAQRFNAIILCKYLELGLTSYPYDDLFIQHCFDQFDRPLNSVRLSKAIILQSNVKPVNSGGKGRGKGKAKALVSINNPSPSTPRRSISSASPRASSSTPSKKKKSQGGGPYKMGSGATFDMIEPLKRMIQRGDFDLILADTKDEQGRESTVEKSGNSMRSQEQRKDLKLPPLPASTESSGGAIKNSASGGKDKEDQTFGFASLDAGALHPSVAHYPALRLHHSRAPVAAGHTSTYAHDVLVAMRKNYDTQLFTTSMRGPSSAVSNHGNIRTTSPQQKFKDVGDGGETDEDQSHPERLKQSPVDVLSSALAVHASKHNGGKTPNIVPLPPPPSFLTNPIFTRRTVQQSSVASSSSAAVELLPNARPLVNDEITYEMFKFAFLSPQNAHWVAAFVRPMLECCLKYFAPPHGELPLVSLRWLKDVSAIPVPEVQYDADAALLKEIEELGYDPWVASFKKGGKKKGSAKDGKEKGTRSKR